MVPVAGKTEYLPGGNSEKISHYRNEVLPSGHLYFGNDVAVFLIGIGYSLHLALNLDLLYPTLVHH